MADTKITGLAAIGANPIIPSTFPLPMVDLTDTSMAASGTTKKVTVNQILGAGGTATLASATITGDLTVDTNTLKVDSANNRVGILTASPITGSSLDVRGAVGTGTDIQSLTLIDTSSLAINNGGGLSFGYVFQSPSTVIGRAGYIKTIKENATDGNYASAMVFGVTANGVSTAERLRIDSSGNLGLGVASSAWGSSYKAIQVAANGVLYANGSNSLFLGGNYYNDSGGTNRYLVSNAATAYGQVSGAHQWFTAPSGTAGNAITFTQAMTLDASGRLGIGITAPEQLLHIANQNGIRFGSAGATPKADIYYSSSGSEFLDIKVQGTTTGYGSIRFYAGPTPSERVQIKTYGQVRFVPLAADPSGAEAGDVYYNSTSNKLKCYNGTSWNDLF